MDESILNKPILTVKQIADKFDKDIEQIQSALEKGINVEKEHTSSTRAAKRIALAHLSERPDYYEKLSKIEKQKINEMKVPRTFHIVRRIIRAKKRKYPDKRRSPIRNFIPKAKMVKPRIPKQKVKITKPRLTWDK